jgi:soluble P-type ATPase
MKTVTIPGWGTIEIRHIVLDLNGTLTESGTFLPGVLDELVSLNEQGFSIHILSGDTRGNLKALLSPFRGLHCRITKTAQAKRSFVESLGPEHVVCIGNGNIDIEMFKIAGLSICPVQGEGASTKALGHADIVVPHIRHAIDLIRDEDKLVATLRG